MDYIREAAEYLKNYDNLLVARRRLTEKITMLKENLSSIKAISYSDMPKGNSKGVSDDGLVNKIFELNESIKLFEENEQAIKATERSLEDLQEDFKKIIWSWYVEEKTETQMLNELNVSRATFYRLKSQAIRIFAIQLFGVRAIL